MKQVRASFFISLAIIFAANSTLFATPPQYQITDLGPGCALSVNNNGQVVGFSGSGSAILFDTTGQGNHVSLGSGRACSINDSGQAVGYYYTPPSTYQAMNYKLNPNGTYTAEQMGTGVATSINNNGQMVGQGTSWPYTSGAAIFTYSESLHRYQTTLLNGISGGGFANSNNDNGQIVGQRGVGAVIWNPDGSGGYATTSLHPAGYNRSEGKSINNSGKIAGESHKINSTTLFYENYRAVLFDETGSGQHIFLGSLSGYTDSWANSINDNGQIVGASFNDYTVPELATLFDPTGGGNNINLNTTLVNPLPGWTLREAYSINENGWIVGYMSTSVDIHAFLLTPVPEPASLMLLGLGGLMLKRRK